MRDKLLFWLLLSTYPMIANTEQTFIKNDTIQVQNTINSLNFRELTKSFTIDRERISKLENIKKLVSAIIWYESYNNHPSCMIGDQGRSIGPMMTSEAVINDVNEYLGTSQYTIEDRTNLEKSIEIFCIYQNIYNPTFDLETAARIWNGGPSGMSKDITLCYWLHIEKKMQNEKLQSQSVVNDTNFTKISSKFIT